MKPEFHQGDPPNHPPHRSVRNRWLPPSGPEAARPRRAARFKAMGLRCALLLLLLALAAPAIHGQEPAGELEIERGWVKVRHQNRDRIYRRKGKRYPIFNGDVVQTRKGTRAKIFMRGDKDVIKLFAKTNFKVETVVPKRSSFVLNIGKAFFSAFSKLRGKRSFSVRTPTATIGIKGTEFVAGTDGVKTFVLTMTGTVTLTSVDFPDIQVEVPANQASAVQPLQPPSPPIEVTPEVQQQIISGDGNDQFEQIPFAPPEGHEAVSEEDSEEEEEAEAEEESEEGEETSEEQTQEESAEAAETDALIAEITEVQSVVQSVQETVQDSTSEVRPSDDAVISGSVILGFDVNR